MFTLIIVFPLYIVILLAYIPSTQGRKERFHYIFTWFLGCFSRIHQYIHLLSCLVPLPSLSFLLAPNTLHSNFIYILYIIYTFFGQIFVETRKHLSITINAWNEISNSGHTHFCHPFGMSPLRLF